MAALLGPSTFFDGGYSSSSAGIPLSFGRVWLDIAVSHIARAIKPTKETTGTNKI